MSALTTLLVRDSIVPIRTIEEAIQRQVISGGDLPTVLLEMGAVPENVLASYLAAQHGLAPAGREEVMEVPERLLATIPKDVAVEQRLIPVGETDDRLIVASAAPIERDQRRELAFVIGRPIENRIAVDLRISAGLERHYGEAASRREQRILRKVSERAPGELREVAPLDPNRAIRLDESDDEPETSRGGAPTRYLNQKANTQKASEQKPSNATGWAKPRSESLQSIRPQAEAEGAVNAPEPARRALARPSSPLVDKHRGPLTARDAVNMLGDAESRDDILAVSMAFIRQFFDFSALFVVHDDEAEGLDAHGAGPSWKELQRLSVPLEAEGTFRAVREQNAARVARLGAFQADDAFLAETKRAEAQPALVAPVAIRQRVILMIYADRSGEGFTISDVPEVVAFLPRISDALQRLILKRKVGTSVGAAKPEPPAPAPTTLEGGFTAPKASTSGDWTVAKKEPLAPVDPVPEQRRKPSYATAAAAAPTEPRPEAFDLLGVPREAPPPPAAEDARRARRAIDTTYRSREASVEVVETSRIADTPGRPASVRPPAPEPEWVSRDARRERGDAEPPVDIVTLPDPRPPSEPPRRAPEQAMPSVIVQADADVFTLVEQLTSASPERAEELVPLVLACQEEALPLLVEAFPGRPWALRSAGPLPRGRDVSGVARALAAFGMRAAPYVAPLLERRDDDERYLALAVARDVFTHELGVPVEHLVYDEDREIRRHAAELLRTLDPASPARREILDRLVLRARSTSEPTESRLHAIAALGTLADAELVPALIELLDDADPSVQGAVMAGLTLITAQDFGAERRRWIAWYERSRDLHRVEWLIDGLMHDAEAVRRVAGAELQRATREYYGFHPVLPRREREIIQKRYRTWWETTGRAQFT